MIEIISDNATIKNIYEILASLLKNNNPNEFMIKLFVNLWKKHNHLLSKEKVIDFYKLLLQYKTFKYYKGYMKLIKEHKVIGSLFRS